MNQKWTRENVDRILFIVIDTLSFNVLYLYFYYVQYPLLYPLKGYPQACVVLFRTETSNQFTDE